MKINQENYVTSLLHENKDKKKGKSGTQKNQQKTHKIKHKKKAKTDSLVYLHIKRIFFLVFFCFPQKII